ncbi:MAG: 3-phosphoshikimate 1-carboxyvinyltransferase [Sedimentisphaerales bacterium]|nr:3-phosphoshikimate 1-carboxyvinyltransferase [Sedimentisphaerales bacterium]
MKLKAEKSVLNGRVAIPGSKSHTIRCVALASLAEKTSEIIAPLDSADTQAAVRAYRQLGAQIECGPTWKITGTGGRLSVPKEVIDVANSGTTMRFAIGSSSLLDQGTVVLDGDEQIRTRPQGALLTCLNDLGAKASSKNNNGKAPIVVQGKLVGGETTVEAVTSQYLSSLLVNTPLAEADTIINVSKLNEVPYVQITLDYLDELGIKYENDRMRRFAVRGGQCYQGFSKRVPADFSSATFFLCAGAILPGEIVLEGLDFNDTQGDKAVVEMLSAMGAAIAVEPNQVLVRNSELHGVELDLNATPDALPAMAVTACFAEGTTRLVNVAQARLKETDRIAVMTQELRKLGAKVEELEDGMVIEGGQELHSAALHGHSDHRVVMALSLAGMMLKDGCVIDTAESVAVTFPNYAMLMNSIGGRLTEMG